MVPYIRIIINSKVERYLIITFKANKEYNLLKFIRTRLGRVKSNSSYTL